MSRISDYLWGEKASLYTLAIVAAILIFGMLGSHLLWTQENRWADIVMNMFYTNDYLHPTLLGKNYYDKPLLSYWMVVGLVKVFNSFSVFLLRFPNALAGFASVFAVYGLGKHCNGRQLGFMAAWVYLTCFGMLFWSRVASADMLNVAGIVIAVWWYFNSKHKISFSNYFLFFVIIVLTCLCKGIVAAVCVGLIILPDWLKEKRWRLDLNLKMLLALALSLVIYFIPFWLSSHVSGIQYRESGLALVFRENFVRYFSAWDNKGPVYTYFIGLPYYLLPWAFAFIPAIVLDLKNWKKLAWSRKRIWWALLLTFSFFTFSQSRRYYYILPLLPFAALATAACLQQWCSTQGREKFISYAVGFFVVFYFVALLILTPLAYSKGGVKPFVKQVKAVTSQQYAWTQWKVVMLGSRMRDVFYVYPATKPVYYDKPQKFMGNTSADYLTLWPILEHKKPNTIYFVMDKDLKYVEPYFKGYKLIKMKPSVLEKIQGYDGDNTAAFVPTPSEN